MSRASCAARPDSAPPSAPATPPSSTATGAPPETEYTRALATQGETQNLLLKLADADFLAGDLATEKVLRERIYGTLDPIDR